MSFCFCLSSRLPLLSSSPPPHSVILDFLPLCRSSTLVIEDPGFCLFVFVCHPRLPPCHPRLPPPSVILAFSPSCHPRHSSNRGSRVLSFCFCLSSLDSFPPLCHPRRLSPTPVPDLRGSSHLNGSSQVKDPVSLPFPSYMPQKPTLDSCFRRNDSRLPFSRLFSGGISCRLPLPTSDAARYN